MKGTERKECNGLMELCNLVPKKTLNRNFKNNIPPIEIFVIEKEIVSFIITRVIFHFYIKENIT